MCLFRVPGTDCSAAPALLAFASRDWHLPPKLQLMPVCQGQSPAWPSTSSKAAMTQLHGLGSLLTPAPVVHLQRVYGIAFPEKDLLKDYQYRMEEARKRDHRNVGTQQQLFMFDRLSPGSAFFLPAGTIVYNTLVNVSRCCHQTRYASVDVKVGLLPEWRLASGGFQLFNLQN